MIPQEDLRRSGVTSIAEALRLVPGMLVARIDANKWAISACGFNGRFVQKLLVLTDGRSVYTPLFSGVFWGVQDVLLEDVERIEVIRGPGATLWGTNAVNGIINIVTRAAQDTQGGLVKTGVGSEERLFGQVRYGGAIGNTGYIRVYAKYFKRDDFVDGSGRPTADGWDMLRGGFRTDWRSGGNGLLTLQADLYGGNLGQTYRSAFLTPPYRRAFNDTTRVSGGNVLGRWSREFSNDSDLQVQFYYDRTEFKDDVVEEVRDTYDLDVQHRFRLGRRQEVVWGLGYRFTRDKTGASFTFSLDPDSRSIDFFSAFLQDNVTLSKDRLRLILGSKFEHNDYTGFEYQPNVRLLWTPRTRHTAWAAISRAVKIPSRADKDVRLVFPTLPPDSLFAGSPPVRVLGVGGSDLVTEKLHAFELGYRLRPTEDLFLDLAGFYNEYTDLRAGKIGDLVLRINADPPHVELPFAAANQMEGTTYGFELAADWRLGKEGWRLRAGYTYLHMELRVEPGILELAETASDESPDHQFFLRSSMNLPGALQMDWNVRYVDHLPAPTQNIDRFFGLDVRLGWRLAHNIELAVVGQDLLDGHHPEFTALFIDTMPTEIQRRVYGSVTWGF